MFSQAAILSDVIRREHALAASPARLERRRLATMAEELRRCTSSRTIRLRSVIGRGTATCSAVG